MKCPKGENYWPCQCGRGWGLILTVTCNEISTAQVAEIFKTSNETAEIDSFHLVAATTLGEVHIPADFLSYRILNRFLTLECPSRVNDQNENEQVPITIDRNAFNLSSNVLKYLTIWNCDLTHLDFAFLNGFDKLFEITIMNPSNIEKAKWDLLPALPLLTKFKITIEKDWTRRRNDWKEWVQKLQPLTNGLTRFVSYAEFDNEVADRLVQWLLNSSVATLNYLEMRQTKLTLIPPKISDFQNLDDLIITCKNSEIKSLAENSIRFDILPKYIKISDCGIRELQSGAIQGRSLYNLYSVLYYFPSSTFFNILIGNLSESNLIVTLDNNLLTRLEWKYFDSYFTNPSFSTRYPMFYLHNSITLF